MKNESSSRFMSVTDKNKQLSSHQTAELCIVINVPGRKQLTCCFSEVRESKFKGHKIVLTRLALVVSVYLMSLYLIQLVLDITIGIVYMKHTHTQLNADYLKAFKTVQAS